MNQLPNALSESFMNNIESMSDKLRNIFIQFIDDIIEKKTYLTRSENLKKILESLSIQIPKNPLEWKEWRNGKIPPLIYKYFQNSVWKSLNKYGELIIFEKKGEEKIKELERKVEEYEKEMSKKSNETDHLKSRLNRIINDRDEYKDRLKTTVEQYKSDKLINENKELRYMNEKLRMEKNSVNLENKIKELQDKLNFKHIPPQALMCDTKYNDPPSYSESEFNQDFLGEEIDELFYKNNHIVTKPIVNKPIVTKPIVNNQKKKKINLKKTKKLKKIKN